MAQRIRVARQLIHTPHVVQISQKRTLRLAYAHYPAFGRPEHLDIAPIVILHGLFGSKQNNRSIGKALSRQLRCSVYALDLRNHGSSPHNADHTYVAMADDVQEFVEGEGLGPVTLLGHSM